MRLRRPRLVAASFKTAGGDTVCRGLDKIRSTAAVLKRVLTEEVSVQ